MVGFLALLPQAPARAQSAVDVAIVLAVDASASVDTGEFSLQMRGIAEAIRHPAVIDAIARGRHGMIAISLVQWSSVGEQAVILPWTAVASAAEAQAVSNRILSAPRVFQVTGTAMSDALAYCMEYMDRLPVPSARRVIDISGDGVNRKPPLLRTIKEEALRRGIVINGLPILSDEPDLDVYYRDWVIAGPGAFVSVADNFRAFAPAMLRKLLREIRGMPMVSKR